MTKEKAQELIHVMKMLMKTGDFALPVIGSFGSIELHSVRSNAERFIVKINRKAKIDPLKYTLLLHFPEEDLLRIDVHGTYHINPDGTTVPCPHIHFRNKDTGKWDAYAFELPAVFGNTEDVAETLRTFLAYCNTCNISELTITEQRSA